MQFCGKEGLLKRDHKRNTVLPGTQMAHKRFRIANIETTPIKGKIGEINILQNRKQNSTKISIKNGGWIRNLELTELNKEICKHFYKGSQ